MAEVKNKTLVKKLVEVSKAIGYLQKDKKNTMQGYSYLSEAKIKETIKKQFEEQGIIFNYSTEEVREYEISPTHKGTKQFVTIANGTYQFIDSDSDVDISGKWFGSGSDTGDKGLYKAITGGIKYVLNTNFLIPTGDDPENDGGGNGNNSGKPKTTPKPKNKAPTADELIDPTELPDDYEPPTGGGSKERLVTKPQLNRLYALMKDAGVDVEVWDAKIKKDLGIEHKSEMTMTQIDKVFDRLEKIIKQNSA